MKIITANKKSLVLSFNYVYERSLEKLYLLRLNEHNLIYILNSIKIQFENANEVTEYLCSERSFMSII